jgi:hypothetical protein
MRSSTHRHTDTPAYRLTGSPTHRHTDTPAHWFALLLLTTLLTIQPVRATTAQAQTLFTRVGGPGLVSVSGAQLAAAGWNLAALDVDRLQVWRRGAQVPIAVVGGEDGRLDAEDQLRWVAGAGTRWSSEEWYWLLPAATPGLRAAEPLPQSQPVHWAPDLLYVGLAEAQRGDRWFAGELREGGPPLTMTLDLPTALPAGRILQVAATSLNRQAHNLVVTIYGQSYRLPSWNTTAASAGKISEVVFRLPRPLPAGATTLSLALAAGPPDAVLIDSITLPELGRPLLLLEPQVESVLDPACTVQSATCLLDTHGGAEQLILADPLFHNALAPLIEAKQRQGMRIALIDPQAIYTAYSWGERDPEAIRAFLIEARQTWPSMPASLLLVGAGGVRQREEPATLAADLSTALHCLTQARYLTGQQNAALDCAPQANKLHANAAQPALVPPYLLDGDPAIGEFPCDGCYGRLDHLNPWADPLPDLAVGRLPVHTPAEAALLSAKIANYLNNPPAGAWRAQHLVVSDNDYSAAGTADPAGPFAPLTTLAATQLPSYQSQLFTYAPERATAPPFYGDPAALRRAFFAAFASGAALLTYVGHASQWQWAAVEPNAEPPYLLSVYDNEWGNGARLPVLLSMACLSGQWSNPLRPSVDEQLLLAPNGGIVASISPAGSGVNTGHSTLLAAVAPALAEGRTLGEALLAGYAALAASGRNAELRYSYNLLGDPDLRLPTTHYRIHLPLVR